MNKKDLVTLLAKKAALTKDEADLCVTTIWDTLGDALARGERIEIRGFGSFSVKQYDAREGHNPRTGARIPIQARRLPHFKPGKNLKERINKKLDEE